MEIRIIGDGDCCVDLLLVFLMENTMDTSKTTAELLEELNATVTKACAAVDRTYKQMMDLNTKIENLDLDEDLDLIVKEAITAINTQDGEAHVAGSIAPHDPFPTNNPDSRIEDKDNWKLIWGNPAKTATK